MLRSLFCAAAIFVLVISVCLLPQTASARRCPVKDPETLLSLYQNSDAIYVAAFDKKVDGEIVETNDDYSVSEIKKHFTISSTLKGENRKFFVLDDRQYNYKTAPQAEIEASNEETREETLTEEPADVDEDGEVEDELKFGDTLLLFVKNGEDEESGPTLTDLRDGIKPLSRPELDVYEARIKELNTIFAEKKVSGTQLLEWLIRCAEDPATRWEGTFELLRSVQAQEWVEQASERRKERIEKGEPVEEAPEQAEDSDVDREEAEEAIKDFDTSVFADMLDANHKQALANLLLEDRNADSKKEKTEAVKGNSELIELLKRWGDPRLIGFLLEGLRETSDDEASNNAGTMETIAEILDDDTAAALAEKYSGIAYEDGKDAVDLSDTAEQGTEEPAEPEAEAPAPDEADPVIDKVEEPATVGEVAKTNGDPEVKKPIYSELRADLIQKFLLQCDKVIADRKAKKEKETALSSTR